MPKALTAERPKSSGVLKVPSRISVPKKSEKWPRAPLQAALGFRAGTRQPSGGHPAEPLHTPATPTQPPARHTLEGLALSTGSAPRAGPWTRSRCRRLDAPVSDRALAPQSARDYGQWARELGRRRHSRTPQPLHREADSSYLPGDRKPPVPPPPSPPPLAHGEPGLLSPTHLLEPPAVSTSPGVSAGLWHGLHRTRRGGSHSRGAQTRSDRTHEARTAGCVASYYGGRQPDLRLPPSSPRFPAG